MPPCSDNTVLFHFKNLIYCIAILVGTFEIAPLKYHVYPPYGFITQAFIPLGSYLLLVGIFSSAKVICRDSAVRIHDVLNELYYSKGKKWMIYTFYFRNVENYI